MSGFPPESIMMLKMTIYWNKEVLINKESLWSEQTKKCVCVWLHFSCILFVCYQEGDLGKGFLTALLQC